MEDLPDFKSLIENTRVSPKRRALSTRFPFLKLSIVAARRLARQAKNYVTIGTKPRKAAYLGSVIARHSSPLRRKLGSTDPALQEGKIKNLKIAIAKLDGIVIPPGKTFSLWHALGRVRRSKGYTDGLLLSDGEAKSGLGGGLCQLSNFLYWIFLHANVKILERHHHSKDVFPDSGRTLPFGSGATIFDNYLDLCVKNISGAPLQIKLWLTEDCLKGQLLSDRPSKKKFHVFERNHCFVRSGEKYFRYNEICRETLVGGVAESEEKIATNFAPVLYDVTQEYIAKNDFKLVEIA